MLDAGQAPVNRAVRPGGKATARRRTSQVSTASAAPMAPSDPEPPQLRRRTVQQELLQEPTGLGHRQELGARSDHRRELIEVHGEAAEEDRRQEHEQGELDRLSVGVRDERDQDADPGRGDDEQPQAGEDGPGAVRNGTRSPSTRIASTASAMAVRAARRQGTSRGAAHRRRSARSDRGRSRRDVGRGAWTGR